MGGGSGGTRALLVQHLVGDYGIRDTEPDKHLL